MLQTQPSLSDRGMFLRLLCNFDSSLLVNLVGLYFVCWIEIKQVGSSYVTCCQDWKGWESKSQSESQEQGGFECDMEVSNFEIYKRKSDFWWFWRFWWPSNDENHLKLPTTFWGFVAPVRQRLQARLGIPKGQEKTIKTQRVLAGGSEAQVKGNGGLFDTLTLWHLTLLQLLHRGVLLSVWYETLHRLKLHPRPRTVQSVRTCLLSEMFCLAEKVLRDVARGKRLHQTGKGQS